MLKDLMASLDTAIDETDKRREMNENALSALSAPSPSVGAGNGRNRSQSRSGPSNLGNRNGVSVNVKGGPRLGAFLKSISAQESGGNYSAVGVPTRYGTAYGKYQILSSNFVGPGGWDKEALGKDITLKQYMNRPRLQEKIAQGKLTNYFKQYGAVGAAKAWYAGPGNARTNSNSPQYGGPSINAYADAVYDRMMGYLKGR